MNVQFSLNRAGDEIHVRFPYDPDLVTGIKKVPGRIFRNNGKDGKYWSVPVAAETAEPLKQFAEQAGVILPEIIQNLLEQKKHEQQTNYELSNAKAETGTVVISPAIDKQLRPFQRAGVEYLIKNRPAILGDTMGLGKTIQSIAAVDTLSAYPCLVVCPASLKYNWLAEWTRWLPNMAGKIELLNGRTAQRREGTGTQIVIINYDVLDRHDWIFSLPWQSVIVDESHYIKNPKSKRSKLVLELLHNLDTRNIFLLTGTAVLNRPFELVPQLSAIRRMDTFGGFWQFVRRYCAAYKSRFGWDFSGAQNTDELNLKLRATCYIRRDKADVLPELPPKTRTKIPVEIATRREYETARRELLEYIRNFGKLEDQFIQSLDGLDDGEEEKQKKIAEYRMGKAARAARAETLVRISTLKQIAARGKLPAVRNFLANFLEQSESEQGKIVVFAQHKDIIEAIASICAELGQVPCILTGEKTAEERQHAVELFQNDPQFRIFIGNIQAAGVGITLTAASYVLFVEFGWTPAVMDQAEDRVHRIGQPDAVNIYYMEGMDTIDKYTIDLIEKKRNVVTETLEGAELAPGAVGEILKQLLGV